MEENTKVPFWLDNWFVIIALLVLPPIGITLLWISYEFEKKSKIVLTVIVCLYMFFMIPHLIAAVVAPFTVEKTVVADTVGDGTFLDQRLSGSWMLSGDNYAGNEYFEYFTLKFEDNGTYVLDAKVAQNKQITILTGTYAVDKNGNLFLTKESGEQITYYYDLVDGTMILQYMEDGKVKLKKFETATTPPVAEQAPATVSIDLSAGVYTVGTDVPPGKYDITAISGSGNFFGNPGIVNEIMGVDGGYSIPTYKNATFVNGNTIEVKGTLIVNLTSK